MFPPDWIDERKKKLNEYYIGKWRELGGCCCGCCCGSIEREL
jgi:hypothetical protein